jgi:hypothetical protein
MAIPRLRSLKRLVQFRPAYTGRHAHFRSSGNQFPAMRLEVFVRALLVAPISREYPATSAARIVVRRRVEAMVGGSPPRSRRSSRA